MSESQKIDAIFDEWIGLLQLVERSEFDGWLSGCESPIERILGAALYFSDIFGYRPSSLGRSDNFQYAGFGRFTKSVTVQRQVDIGGWRVDFLVSAPGLKIIVECDGHAFHERTPEQAERDRSRDRGFQQQGYAVMRFTGREIYRDPTKCAAQVTKFIEDRVTVDSIVGEG